MSIAIFGACREGRDVAAHFRALYLTGQESAKQICFLDNDSRLQGSLFEGLPIYHPSKVGDLQVDHIIIGVIYNERISNQLREYVRPDQKVTGFYSDCYFNTQKRRIGMAEVGGHSYFKPSTIIYNAEIGRYCHIGADCRIALMGHNQRLPVTYPLKYQSDISEKYHDVSEMVAENPRVSGRVIIEDGVYIGEGVSIMSPVRIGRGSIIGSRAVVSKDVPRYSVAVGVPAKTFDRKISSDLKEKLEESKWWTKEPPEASRVVEELMAFAKI